MDAATLAQLKKSLEAERDRLVAELQSFAKPAEGVRGDWDAEYPKFETSESGSHASLEEKGDEVEEYEMRLAAEHSLESRLLEVTQALERMGKGTYGVCTKCRKPMQLERLRANPAAEFDVEHAK